MIDTYRKAKNPFVKGELRVKAWRALLPPTVAQDDPLWAQRCEDYWKLQERVYGVRMAGYSVIINANEGVVATYAVVSDVLPGDRV